MPRRTRSGLLDDHPDPGPQATRRSRDPQTRAQAHLALRTLQAQARESRTACPPRTGGMTRGTVIWARVAWTEGGGEKTRPAVVLTAARHDVQILALSRLAPGRLLVPLRADEEFLPRPTGCRLTPATVERVDVLSVAGVLSPINQAVVDTVILTTTLTARARRAADAAAARVAATTPAGIAVTGTHVESSRGAVPTAAVPRPGQPPMMAAARPTAPVRPRPGPARRPARSAA